MIALRAPSSPVRDAATPAERVLTVVFALTVATSAALLFVVQPMFARLLLPRLGGTPAVWNACPMATAVTFDPFR